MLDFQILFRLSFDIKSKGGILDEKRETARKENDSLDFAAGDRGSRGGNQR